MVTRWVDEMPIQSRRSPNERYNWYEIADDLRADPGRWALVAENVPRSHASQIRAGQKKAFQPPEDWLVQTKGPRGTRGDIYMAFIGAPGARLRATRGHGRYNEAPRD
jgi:hypothetical protein